MANNDFTGTASTALTTYDSSWANCVFNAQDGVADLNLSGGGRLRTGAFKFSSGRRTDGNSASKSRIVIKAGEFDISVGQIRVAVRRGATNCGYTAEPYSSTGVSTNIDFVKIYRDNVFMSQPAITPINATTTDIDIQVIFSGTVDVQAIINGQTVTATGTGGNDASGAAPLTGGTAGLDIFSNTGTVALLMIKNWTDDASGSNTTITPGTGSLSITGAAPVVNQGTMRVPLTGALALTAIAAIVTQQFIRIPGTGSLALTGNAPVVTKTGPIQPATGLLALTGYAPVVTQQFSRIPGTGSLALTGNAPTIIGQGPIQPAAGSLALTGYQPVLTLSVPPPPTGSLALTGYAPVLSITVARQPVTGALALTGYAPVVTQQFNRIPLTGTLALTGNAPLIAGQNTTIVPGTGSLSLTGYAASAISPITIVPGTGTLTINGSAPALITSSPVITPAKGTLAFTGYAPVVINSGSGSTPGIGGLGISNPLIGIGGPGIGGLGIS